MLVWWWSDTCVASGSSTTRCEEGAVRGPRGKSSSGSVASSTAIAADNDTTPNIQLFNPPVRVHMVVPLAVVLVSFQNAFP